MKKLIRAVLLLNAALFFAEEALPLLDTAAERGITVYWDALNAGGLLEKDGHQLSFRAGEELVMLDGSSFTLTDAPSLSGSGVTVTENFLSVADDLFGEKPAITPSEASFKIGAVVIDPGHGGKDPGTSRAYTIKGKKIIVTEKDIALTVGKTLYSRLKQAFPSKQIIMTRSSDVFLSLSERTEIANSVKLKKDEAVLYVSIHVNASLDRRASGYEVWYLSPGYRRTVLDKASANGDSSLFLALNSMMEEEYTAESILMSKFIMDGLKEQVGDKSKARGIKAEEWFVVRNTNMPSVLIELGFLSNQAEAMNLNDGAYLQKAATGIYNGITAFVTHFERSRGFTSKK
ncbi:MAG: N-acetylmuramoyl-L-alanine amidase family protein [Treponema sp.]